MFRAFAVVFLLVPGLSEASKVVEKGPTPDWVKIVEPAPPKEAGPDDGSVRYLLANLQEHLEEETLYSAMATEILTPAGAEDYSQISVDFQPTYQTLTWHALEVVRDGEIQDRLPAAEFEVIRREKGLDRQLYDGELTAHVILKDIKPGDQVRYAYSIHGENPIFSGHVHDFTRLAYGIGIGRIYRAVLWDESKRNLKWQIVGGDVQVEEIPTEDGIRKLVYDKTDIEKWETEKNTPSWYEDYPYLEISDYESWEEFQKWALPIYWKDQELPAAFTEICDQIKAKGESPEKQAIEVLRWVQENIRYLGSFFGNHTHEPYPLSEIDGRRFGDCKDKGMTTIAMLRYLGLDAAPALVNTYYRHVVEDRLPGHSNFDHLIVHLKLDGVDYWLDPTRSFQRGTLKNSYSPDYGYAFVIRPESKSLVPAKPAGFEQSRVSITESFDIPDMSGNATLKVRTVATGYEADKLRRTFASDSLTDTQESYRDYYEKDYPGITLAGDITFTDDEVRNKFVILESYSLTGLWDRETNNGEPDQDYAWFYARYISSYANTPSEKPRKFPYEITHPIRLTHIIEAKLPSDWDIPEGSHERNLPALDYSFDVTGTPRSFRIKYEYATHSDHIKPEDFAGYRETMALLRNDLNYYVSNPIITTEAGGEVAKSYTFISAFLVTGFIAGLALAILFWFWNPAPRPPDPGSRTLRGIGGWLVLPTLGSLILPLIWGYEASTYLTVIDAETFTLFSDFENETMQRVAFAFGSFFATLFFALSILQLCLLFSHRTSFPTIYIAIGIGGLLIDSMFVYLSSLVSDTPVTPDEVSGIVRAAISVALWSAYMLRSQRVRNTFIRRRGSHKRLEARLTPPPLPVHQ